MAERCVVTGGAGVIGNHLVERLVVRGDEVRVIDRLPRPTAMSDDVDYVQGDLVEVGPAVISSFDATLVFHLAASFERSEEAPEFWRESAHDNVAASATTLEGAARSPNLRRYVFASSYLTYDPAQYLFHEVPADITTLDESSNVTPRNVTGAAKLLHESEIDLATRGTEAGFDWVSARIFRVYGPSSRDVISRWVRAGVQGEPIEVFGEEGRFDFVFSDDVAEGLLRLGDAPTSGVFNLGSGQARSVGEVVAVLRQHFPALAAHAGASPEQYEASQASMDRFRQVIDWSPPTTLEDGISLLVEHERRNAAANTISRRVLPPKRLNALITSLAAKSHVPRAVRRAFVALDIDGTVWGGDTDELAVAQAETDRFWHMPRLDDLAVETLEEFCATESVGLIIPTRDGELGYFANHQDRLQRNGVFVPIGAAESIRLANDKLQFARHLEDAGLEAIPTYEELDPIGSKLVVVKPRFGAGSSESGVGVAQDIARELATKIERPVFQPYLAGTEYSIDVYVTRNDVTLGAIARKRTRVVHGESRITTVVDDQRLRDLGVACVEALGVRGHAVVQVIDADAGSFLVECNSRVGGASSAAWLAGLRSVDAMVLEALGEEPGPFAAPQGSLTMRRSSIDLIEWS